MKFQKDGFLVLSLKGNNMPKVLTHKGFKNYVGLIENINTDIKIKLTFSNKSSLVCTEDHKLLMYDNSFEYVNNLNVGDVLYNNISIIDKEFIHYSSKVYDLLEVEDTHSYLTNGVVSGNCIMLDEFAFVQHGMAHEFFQSTYPVISSGKTTKVIIVSTPNGLNHFYKMWVDAMEGRSLYVPYEIHWNQVPGRDEAWKNETIRNTSEQQFQQEFESSDSKTLINTNKGIKQIGELYNELQTMKK
jgi:hypothetical protein